MSKSSSESGGISLFGLVFIVFLFLKLAGIGEVATWSWWWVTSPLWGGFALIFGIFFLWQGFKFIVFSKPFWRKKTPLQLAEEKGKKREAFEAGEDLTPRKKSNFQMKLEAMSKAREDAKKK